MKQERIVFTVDCGSKKGTRRGEQIKTGIRFKIDFYDMDEDILEKAVKATRGFEETLKKIAAGNNVPGEK